MRFDIVIVLGVHRSGTSAITKGLELFGVDLGQNLLPANEYNPKGYFEDNQLVDLNDNILRKSGSLWSALQFLEPADLLGARFEKEQNEAREFLKGKLAQGTPIGLKDPRLCRTLPFWQKIFEEQGLRVGYLLAYRSPDEVAASLKKRDDFSIEYGENLWTSYQVDALRHLNSKKWLVIKYENLLKKPRRELRRVSEFLGAEWHPEDSKSLEYQKRFLDSSSRHHRKQTRTKERFRFIRTLILGMELLSQTSNSVCRWSVRAAAELVFNQMRNDPAFSIVEKRVTWPTRLPSKGFWRRMEDSIRKRRRRWIALIGFDEAWYLKEYPEVGPSGIDPLHHYVEFGFREGRWKSQKSKNRALEIREKSPSRTGLLSRLWESLRKGGRKILARAGFDPKWYLQEYPDVQAAGLDPFQHFFQLGLQEGRHKSKKQMEKSKQGEICAGLSAKNKGGSEALSKFGPRDRGLILFVVHDAHVGGAQHVARIIARWLLKATRFQVKFVILSGGGLVHEFLRIAPVLDLSSFSNANIEEKLMKFLGEEPCVVFINSVVSARFLEYWKSATPVIAFIHEMGKSLSGFPKELDLLLKRASVVIAGGNAVRDSLAKLHGWERVSFQTVGAFVEDDIPLFAGSAHSKMEAKRKIGIDEDSFLVVGCGNLISRKSPQEFVRVAGQVVSGTPRKVKFLWVGSGPDLEECQKIAQNLGIEEKVHFVGYQGNIQPFLHAADLFLLPSKEDPFPLVSLYAGLASCPVICFAQAGGIPDVISRGGGRIVPFGDLEAMAGAVLGYISNEPARNRDGQILRDFVRDQHTVASGGPNLLHWIREVCHLQPHVSVVVPNYNHAAFLKERLQSIVHQTYQDFELILLDDSSTDDSCVQLEAWVLKRVGTRLLRNVRNSGSAFGQWQKGFSLAQGSMVWIAEADDSCDPRFLENLVPEFDDRNVFLGYVKSVPIDYQGAKLGDYDELYLNRINPGRWLKDYRATDNEEANQGLGIANCIPNVSSVLIRTFQPEAEFFSIQTGMKICGDWLFYLRAMRGGMVSYCAKPLNMHRRHQRSVTVGTEGTQKYFSEFCRVREFVSANYRLEELTENRIAKFDQEEAKRFKVAEQKPSSTSANSRTRLPAVLFVASDLSPGGGQMFIIHLANEWALRGGRAILLSAQKYPDHSQVTAKINPRVALFSKAEMTVNALVARFGLEIVHSAIWWADDLVRQTIGKVGGVPWVVTMHGCHETLLDHPETDSRFHEKSMEMLGRVDAWVYTAEKNKRLFESHGWPKKTQRIDNGVALEATFGLTRQSIGLSDSALVLCLASRAIFEKGWLEAVAAFKEIHARRKNVELLLIGEGPAAESVKKALPPGVKLLGQVANLQDYLALADIVLLPSYFVGESLPLVLLEAMALGKPFVATSVGEIPKLVESEGDAVGVLIPLVNGRPDINNLVSGIERLADPKVRQAMGKNAVARHKREYTLNIMVDRYNSLYRKCIANRRVN